jgi:hypothetical protein
MVVQAVDPTKQVIHSCPWNMRTLHPAFSRVGVPRKMAEVATMMRARLPIMRIDPCLEISISEHRLAQTNPQSFV